MGELPDDAVSIACRALTQNEAGMTRAEAP